MDNQSRNYLNDEYRKDCLIDDLKLSAKRRHRGFAGLKPQNDGVYDNEDDYQALGALVFNKFTKPGTHQLAT
jgi:hypothetical protein